MRKRPGEAGESNNKAFQICEVRTVFLEKVYIITRYIVRRSWGFKGINEITWKHGMETYSGSAAAPMRVNCLDVTAANPRGAPRSQSTRGLAKIFLVQNPSFSGPCPRPPVGCPFLSFLVSGQGISFQGIEICPYDTR
jgi:hypothetical protein